MYRKQTTLAQRPLVGWESGGGGVKRAGGGGGALAGEGDWGSCGCFSYFLQKPFPALAPGTPILVASYLSPFSRLLGKRGNL